MDDRYLYVLAIERIRGVLDDLERNDLESTAQGA